jgi:NADH-quinone oxidoreductase subunit L
MHGDPHYSRFFGFLNLFAFSMLMLVLGGNFLLTFLGWEGVGLCSYLLVSFWFERKTAAVAGQKAFITNRVADFGFMLAMFLIVAKLGTLEYIPALEGADTLASGTVTAIALLLFLGAIGKSAQIPLHLWLPDAMEGPTPVSALIHAATMVTGGIYLIARAHPFFEAADSSALTTVAWVGALGALLAGTVAVAQNDIKKVLAYSTISQLGYMFLALGVGAYVAAIFHVITHAFFKATLFLGSGSVIHGVDDNQDMRIMGGLRKFLPFTSIAMIIGWLAIAGVPPFSGFWSKDEILASAWFSDDYALWAVGLLGALLTAFYMTRLVYMTFYGPERFHAEEGAPEPEPPTHERPIEADEPPPVPAMHHEPHEAPGVMTAPVLVLAGLAIVGGLLNLPFIPLEFLSKWLEPVFEGVSEPHPSSFVMGFTLSAIAVVVALTGIVLGLRMYRRGIPNPEGDPLPAKLGRADRVLARAYYYNAGVARVVEGPGRAFSQWLNRIFDQRVIDGAVNGVAAFFRGFAGRLRRVQTGLVREYALGVVIGAVCLLLFVATRVV